MGSKVPSNGIMPMMDRINGSLYLLEPDSGVDNFGPLQT